MIYHPVGRNIQLRWLLVGPTGVGVTGVAPTISIQRRSDGQWWNGSAFAGTKTLLSTTEQDAVNLPGAYVFQFNQSVAGGTPEEYLMRFELTTPFNAVSEEQHIFTNFVTASLADRRVGSAMADDGVSLQVALWVEESGLRVTDYTSIAAQLRDSDGVVILDFGVDNVDTAQGIFSFTKEAASVPRNCPLILTIQALRGVTTDNFNIGMVRV